ncbi:MAG TPA: hypothetical protein PKA13_25625, partial [Geminicoccaceae bacterium]|nr:hypothetical protein [Geminicoccus sp.]HMU53178.1 hypothetical protein [Geminicoccaceae bacterium]
VIFSHVLYQLSYLGIPSAGRWRSVALPIRRRARLPVAPGYRRFVDPRQARRDAGPARAVPPPRSCGRYCRRATSAAPSQ